MFSFDLYVMDVAALGAVEKESETICYRMDGLCVSEAKLELTTQEVKNNGK